MKINKDIVSILLLDLLFILFNIFKTNLINTYSVLFTTIAMLLLNILTFYVNKKYDDKEIQLKEHKILLILDIVAIVCFIIGILFIFI